MAVIVHREDSPHAANPEAGIPQYRSHKVVKAIKIGILHDVEDDGTLVFEPEDRALGVERVFTEPEYSHRFHGDAEDMGYWVQYADGYESWSPSEVFETGYTRILEQWS